MLLASIDLGSNTVKCAVGSVFGDRLHVVAEHVVPSRLGEGMGLVGGGGLLPDAVARTVRVIDDLAAWARGAGADRFVVAGTQAVRECGASEALRDGIRRATGAELIVLSAKEEAELSFLGAAGREREAGVLDIGGGSTEWVLGGGGQVRSWRSFLVGVVRWTERFGTEDRPDPKAIRAMDAALGEDLAALREMTLPEGWDFLGVGATPVWILAVAEGLRRPTFEGEERVLSRDALGRVADLLARTNQEERMALADWEPSRADVIVAGARILLRAVEILGVAEVRVTWRGLRHGVLLRNWVVGAGEDDRM